jgi:DNA-binding beta-propeller fold protein YncE
LIAATSGNNQVANAGDPVASPLVVKVTDALGNGVPGVNVYFGVAGVSGGGSVSPSIVPTNASGLAAASFVLGTNAGPNVATASAIGPNGLPLVGAPVVFDATGAGFPTNLVLVSGNGQTGPTGLPLTSPFVVTVVDAAGTPVAGRLVTFAVTSGNGVISAATATSDANGKARATLTLGPAGPQSVNASTVVSGGGTVTVPFSATSTAPVGLPVTAVDGIGALDTVTNTGAFDFNSDIMNAPCAAGIGGQSSGYFALDSVNHRLFVADDDDRVLVFQLSTSNDFTGTSRTAVHVLGQTGFAAGPVGKTPTSSTFGAPLGLAFDSANNRLFVADTINNRILVFDTTTIYDGMPAIAVLGQPDFTTPTHAVPPTQQSIGRPIGLAWDAANSRLFIASSTDNRVLVYTTFTTGGPGAVNELGQAAGATAFTTAAFGNGQSSMNSPRDVALDPNPAAPRLFVSEAANNRVLVFDLTSGITDGMNAWHILGQSGPGLSQPSTSISGLASPFGVAFGANKLFVGDRSNFRVMMFDTTSGISDGMSATAVLGQSGFGTLSAPSPPSASTTYAPSGVLFDAPDNHLFVFDDGNCRCLLFDTTSVSNGMAAVDGIGHLVNGAMDFTRQNFNDCPTKTSLSLPGQMALDPVNHRLYVADTLNYRVLAYALSPTNDFTGMTRAASFVIGQPNFGTSPIGATSAQTLSLAVYGLALDVARNRLFVADTFNQRILVYDTTALANGMAATNVLGQPDFSSNQFGKGANALTYPHALAYDPAHDRLFVADLFNNRVLVFDTSTITNGMSAVAVLGQTGFGLSSPATTQSGMIEPSSVAYDAIHDRLFVQDSFNARVLVFDTGSIVNGMNAAHVIGQSSFTSSAPGLSQTSMSFFSNGDLCYDGANDRLFVCDTQNARVLLFSTAAIGDGMVAAKVFGQPDFTTKTQGNGATGLADPDGVLYDPVGNHLFIGDFGGRVLIYNNP